MAFLTRLCLKTYKLRKVPVLNKLWWNLYEHIKKSPQKCISLKIHGYKVYQPSAYGYPFASRLIKNFNNPLIECIYQTSTKKNRKVTYVDIGAAIGDTVFLLKANCDNMMEKIYCVDGDKEFFEYLIKNMSRFSDVECINTILSDKNEQVNSLVRIHAGTASSQGSEKVEALSFDELVILQQIKTIDVLKVDVDGYDGKVLSGARNSLLKFKPTVIFEWHPVLCKQTQTDYNVPFEILYEQGYNRFLWFTKYGDFSHFTFEFEKEYTDQFAEICLKSAVDDDLHYDIVALHNESKLCILDFANSSFSKAKKKPFLKADFPISVLRSLFRVSDYCKGKGYDIGFGTDKILKTYCDGIDFARPNVNIGKDKVVIHAMFSLNPCRYWISITVFTAVILLKILQPSWKSF